MTPKTFQKSFFKIKNELRHLSGKHMHAKCGVHKMATPLGITRGSSLNMSLGKCGIWLVNQRVPTSLCAFVCLIIDYTLRALDIIILNACLVIVYLRHWHTNYIDWFSYLSSYIDFSCHMSTLLTLTYTFFLFLISFILTWLILLVVYYLDYHGACYLC